MVDTQLTYKISAAIGFTIPTSSLYRQTPSAGQLVYDAARDAFIVTLNNKLHKPICIPMKCVVPPTKEMCPRGTIYPFDFDIPGYKYKQCFLKHILEDDKKLIHNHILKRIGVKKKLFTQAPSANLKHATASTAGINRMASSSTGINQPKTSSKSLNRSSPVTLSSATTSQKPTLVTSPIRQRRSPPKHHPPTKKHRLDNQDRLVRPTTAVETSQLMPSILHNTIKATTSIKQSMPSICKSKTVIRTAKSFESLNVNKDGDSKLQDDDEVVEDSLDSFSPEPMKRVMTPEPPKIIVPIGEDPLPEEYMQEDFWAKLKDNKEVRAGVCGEWVKGKDEQLTIDGLLCLRDGEWVIGDLIDAYLQHICRKNLHPHPDNKENLDNKEKNKYAPDNIMQYVPTFALVRYNTLKRISSKWYWRMNGVETVFAPVHINDNHWAMAVARMEKKEIVLMDSMNHGFAGSGKMEFMNKFLDILMEVAEQFTMCIGTREDWKLTELLDVPQQRNGIDCGIFALLYAYYEAEGRCLDFTQEHIGYFRRKICKDILSFH
ncbi:hypothetical protein ACQ4LE_006376 [Meloidogyne hapla]